MERFLNFFPEGEIKVFEKDPEWMSSDLKKIKQQKMREYMKHQRSEKYLIMEEKYQNLKAKQMKNYIQKKIESLRTTNASQYFKEVKELGNTPGEKHDGYFTISSHIDRNLSSLESAEIIAKQFSEVSQKFEPLDINQLPDRVKDKLTSSNVESGNEAPKKVFPHEVLEVMKKRKPKSSKVPNNLPPKIKKEFSPELATPLADIFNNIFESGEYQI